MSMDADAILDRRRLKRRLTVWRLIAILALIALVVTLVARTVLAGRERLARLSIEGIVVEDMAREEALAGLVEDQAIKALIVRINSPGGTTAGSEALFHALRRIADNKPVIAVIGTLGASGGYIVALAADRVIARETSLTGSIGVLMQTAEFTGLLEKLGVKADMVKSGELKGVPSPLEPLSPQARKITQALIGDSHDWFRGLVSDRRGLNGAALDAVTDGRIFTGRQALAAKLIDEIGGEHEARAWLESEHGLDRELPIVEITWQDDASLAARFFSGVAAKTFMIERLTLDGLWSLWQPR